MSQGDAKEAVLLGRVGGHAGKWMKGEEGRLNVRIAAPTSVEEKREPTAQDGEKQEEGSQSLTATNMKDILLLVISSIRRY